MGDNEENEMDGLGDEGDVLDLEQELSEANIHDVVTGLQHLQSHLEALRVFGEESSLGRSDELEGAGDSATEQEAGVDEDMEGKVDTFLEFTGSQDRERALRYLTAADGRLEQAVNLFLSGTPLELLEVPTPSRNRFSRAFRGALSRFSTQQDADAGSPDSGNSGSRGWVYQRSAGPNTRRADLVGSALLALTGADLDEPPSRILDLQSNSIMDDSQRASAHLDALRAGIWDKCPEIGAACLRSVSIVEAYLELDLCKVISECLPMAICAGEDAVAVRFLQLIECTMRIVCDGHSAAVDHCGWWFIPARRSGNRRHPKSSYTEMFLEQVVPKNDVEGLKQLWLNENFDPSWRDKKADAEMLACALFNGCTPELLQILVDPVNGCRANVNPDPDRLGSLASPLVLAATAVGFEKLWKRAHESQDDIETESAAFLQDQNEWSRATVEILLDAGACVDEDLLTQMETMTNAARELILQEKEGKRISRRQESRPMNERFISNELVEQWWQNSARRFMRSLLRAIGLTKHNATMHRSMEILSMLVERFRPAPKLDAVNTLGKLEYEKLMQLLQSVFTPENDDVTALLLSVKTIEGLLDTTKTEDLSESRHEQHGPESQLNVSYSLGIHAQLCLSLCRFGISFRLRELSTSTQKAHNNQRLEAAAKRVVEKVSSCVVDKLRLAEETLLGRSEALMDVCDRLKRGDTSVIEQLVQMMGSEKVSSQPESQFYDHDDDDGDMDSTGVPPHREDEQTDDESSQLVGIAANNVTGESSHPSSYEFYCEVGITAFEFEQSGLPSALLHFLLAKDITDRFSLSTIRHERMQALLSAMPPPVVGGEDAAEMEDEEEVKTGEGEKDEKSGKEDGGIGTSTADDYDDDDDKQLPVVTDRDLVSPGSGGVGTGMVGEELSTLQYKFGSSGRRNRSHTLSRAGRSSTTGPFGRQSSMTLDSDANLATNSIESIRSGNGNDHMDPSSFTTSALFRLISKLQMVLAVHALHNFPVIAHDSTASSGGVRALVNPRKIHLRRDDELDHGTQPYPEAQELVVQVLPLTPLNEFQKQVLRAVRITDLRYDSFCRKLVGRKIIHRLAPQFGKDSTENPTSNSLASPGKRSLCSSPVRSLRSPGKACSPARSVSGADGSSGAEYTLALVLRYDPYTGAHLLQDLGSSTVGNKGSSLVLNSNSAPGSRILNKKGNKQWFLMCLRDYQILERVFDGPSQEESVPEVIHLEGGETKEGLPDSSSADRIGVDGGYGSTYSVGSEVAVWWRGSEQLPPGWRAATVRKVNSSSAEAPTYDVSYDSEELVFDDIIRVGDTVKLVEDAAELERILHFQGWTSDMAAYCGQVAKVTSIRDSQVRTNGLGEYTYNMKALRKVPPVEEREVGEMGRINVSTMEEAVPQRRVFDMESISNLDDRHVFSVFLVPENNPGQSLNAKAKEAKKELSTEQRSETITFKLNDRIEGRYAGKSRYYKGRIARVNADGTYDIAYDDGDSERGVKPHLVCHIGKGPGNVVSYDFRKVFPNATGRALFDSLRREDSVLQTEYNFVTRGFEHQPDFYANFAATLEEGGSGVFAQFQTRQQAEILFDRVQRCGQTSKISMGRGGGYGLSPSRSPGSGVSPFGSNAGKASPNSALSNASATSEKKVVSALVDIFPKSEIPAVIERDIIAAFEQVRSKLGRSSKRAAPQPPPPGFRAQVKVLLEDFSDPLTRKDEQITGEIQDKDRPPVSEDRWVSATIIGRRKAPDERFGDALVGATKNNNEEERSKEGSKKPMVLTCVLDDGRIIWDVPESRVRVAQRTSRSFPFKTKERSHETDTTGGLSPAMDGAPASGRDHLNQAEPVELSRQFTAFGQSTSYKRIRFSSFNEEDEEELGIQTFDDETEDDYDSDDGAMVPPRIEVDFLICPSSGDETLERGSSSSSSGSDKLRSISEADGTMPVLANQDGEISMFQALFQLENVQLLKEREQMSKEDNTEAYKSHATKWQNEFWLKWRVRCIFPGDPSFEVGSTRLRNKLPWRTPRALAYDVSNSRSLTLEGFCEKLLKIVPDFEDWARRNKLDDILNYINRRSAGSSPDSSTALVENGRQRSNSRSQINVNWAAICAAYSQLCQRSYISPNGDMSPSVSPIRSPTLLKKDFLGIKMIGSESFQDTSADGAKKSSMALPSSLAAHPPTPPAAISLQDIPSPTLSDASIESHNSLEHVRALLEDCGVEESVSGLRDTLLLLHLLFSELVPFDESADPLAAAFGKSLPWRNETLSDLLREQLSDPLAIATRCFPKWVAVFPREFSFLFRTKIRQIHLRCTALGVSRAVAWLQDEVTGYKAKKRQLAHITLEISAMFRGVPDMARFEHLQELSDRLEDELKAIEQEHCIGQLHQDLVKVNRSELLHDAEQLMRQHMKQRSELVVQFLEETGAGDGVTMDFYSSVSERLQLLDENKKIPMWVSPSSLNAGTDRDDLLEADGVSLSDANSTNTISEGSGEETGETSIPPGASPKAGQEEKYEEEDLHVVSPGGLFPQPLLPLGSVRGSFGDYNRKTALSVNTQSSLPASSKLRVPESRVEVGMRLEEAEGKDDGLRVETKEIIGDMFEDGLRMAEDRNLRVVQRFRFLGRLMAKALLDGMNVPIPLSPEFFMLLQQRQRGSHDMLLPVSTLSLIEGSEVNGDGDGVGAGIEKIKSTSSFGIIRRLYELQKVNDMDAIQSVLEEVDLRFVDPSQPPLPFAENEFSKQEGEVDFLVKKNLTEDFESLSVPLKGASSDELLEYAERASLMGRSQAQIDEALADAGHAKLLRWKAIKGSQKTRTKISLERAEVAEKVKEKSASVVASELIPGGAGRKVTASNLGEFLELILLWWLGHGIERQADAFCDGLCDVLGTQGRDALLFNFSHSELRRMLCGKEEIQWKEDEPLLGCIVPMGDYREDSPSIKMLVEVLKQMTMRERAQFLNFVTSQPRVPLSGLPQIKVYPPTMERIPGVIVRIQNETDRPFRNGDRVVLVSDYKRYGDASNGPLAPGDVGLVSLVENRIRVGSWWYDPGALQLVKKESKEDVGANKSSSAEEFGPKEEWFKTGDYIRTVKARAKIESWDAETNTIYFHKSTDMAIRRTFKIGQSLDVVPGTNDVGGGGEGVESEGVPDRVSSQKRKHPIVRVEKVLEHPQSIQMRPYLRPKATTCVKTLYLPTDYDSADHMLEVFRGAFADAKLGGIHEA